jgi:hypothetical protein
MIGYRERNEEDRQLFLSDISRIPKDRVVYVDEAGVDNKLYRPHGRSPRGV